ncbi:MAG: cell envelope integrity protein CreD, partial [Acidobacteriota bacterium]|nr:cell envelope integrity protein CreD [Acidobacteriota bacterium]
MNQPGTMQFPVQFKLGSRSIGIKLIVVCGLALLMVIPALFVVFVVQDRQSRENGVIHDISESVGGQQTFLGPVLAIPYTIAPRTPSESVVHGSYIVSPAEANALARTTTEERHRSLFKVPVYQADMDLESRFDLTNTPTDAPDGAQLDWSRAEIFVGVSGAHGALSDATLRSNGKSYTLTPTGDLQGAIFDENQKSQLSLTLFKSQIPDLAKPGARFTVSSSMQFSGAQRLAVLAYGKSTHLVLQGDWPNPGFDGGFLPVKRTLSSNGFTAEWSVPYIARGVRAEGPSGLISGLSATSLGVNYVEVADPYQSVTRAIKYVPLFLGLVFLTYFIFEVTTGKRVHPAQYILVGVAQLIFYLLLLSFAERIGFDFGFLIAGGASVALLATNAGWIFASRLQGYRALTVFSLLYALIYLLLRLEDNALMVGAIASFAAVAAVMYF